MKLNDVIKYNKLVWERLYTVKVAQSCPTLCDSVDCKSMEFSRQEYWSGLPFPSPGDLPNPGIEPRSPALQADSLPAEPPAESPVTFSQNHDPSPLQSPQHDAVERELV